MQGLKARAEIMMDMSVFGAESCIRVHIQEMQTVQPEDRMWVTSSLHACMFDVDEINHIQLTLLNGWRCVRLAIRCERKLFSVNFMTHERLEPFAIKINIMNSAHQIVCSWLRLPPLISSPSIGLSESRCFFIGDRFSRSTSSADPGGQKLQGCSIGRSSLWNEVIILNTQRRTMVYKAWVKRIWKWFTGQYLGRRCNDNDFPKTGHYRHRCFMIRIVLINGFG